MDMKQLVFKLTELFLWDSLTLSLKETQFRYDIQNKISHEKSYLQLIEFEFFELALQELKVH